MDTLITIPLAVHTAATVWPARGRRSTDIARVLNLRPTVVFREPIVVQRPGGPLYDCLEDPEWSYDDTPAHGIERLVAAGSVRTEIG